MLCGVAIFNCPEVVYGSVWSAAFSALQKTGKNIEMAASASVFRFRIGVVRPCGCCPRLLPGSCPVPARRLVPARFLPGSCPVPARFLPDGRAGTACPRSGGSCAGQPGSNRRTTRGCCTTLVRILCGRFLDDPKPRGLGSRGEKGPSPCCHWPFLYRVPALDF